MRFSMLLLTAIVAITSAAPTPNADVGCIPSPESVDGVDKRCVGFIAAAVEKRDA
ncbi:hypothetical protein PVAG01_07879 [Phlyctema vagabunda]|uniref:Uncharacterized protein n=1 Tax=Phlyctema vagabunda TaxID=108571 RepID=A0ABR4PDP0_9HELO